MTMTDFDNLFLTFVVSAIVFFTVGTAYIIFRMKTSIIANISKVRGLFK